MLLRTVGSARFDPKALITHHFPFDRIVDAYETFGNAATHESAESHHRVLTSL